MFLHDSIMRSFRYDEYAFYMTASRCRSKAKRAACAWIQRRGMLGGTSLPKLYGKAFNWPRTLRMGIMWSVDVMQVGIFASWRSKHRYMHTTRQNHEFFFFLVWNGHGGKKDVGVDELLDSFLVYIICDDTNACSGTSVHLRETKRWFATRVNTVLPVLPEKDAIRTVKMLHIR